ncbi:hypothetical protein OYC64_018087 [Pagothenia borchgrevinki]|uniref:Uncharacterized protein n=1 Tax=Pagothenia borchgrevinki TaxID=8213 RepID=A0ABD2GP46_PAGBO
MELIDFNSTEEDPPINFFLSSLEEQIRVELHDSKARLTPSKSEGRVHLEIQEDLLANLLDHLQERREDDKCSPKQEGMQKEICSLQAHFTESVSEVEYLKSQLIKVRPMLRKAQEDLVQQTATNKVKQMALERMKAEKDALQSELCAIRPMLELESYLELERAKTRKITTALKKAEDLLATERLRFQQEIKTLQDVKHQTSTNKEQQMALEHIKAENKALQSELCVLRPMLGVAKTNVELELESYLELERGETRKITTALKKAEDLLATERLQFKQEITDLQDLKHQTSLNKDKQLTLEHMKAEHEALQSELCAIRPMLVVSNTNLELERAETRKITTALKKAEDLLATERLRFQQEIKTLQDVKHQTSTNKEQQMALEHMKAENQALQSELCVLRPMLCVEKTNVELESHLELERGETRKITTALKKAEDLLATERLQFKQEITDLQDLKHQTSLNKDKQLTLEHMKAEHEALQSELCAIRPMLVVSNTNLELERGETRKITTALKKAEDLLATERLRFQQEIKTLQDVKHQTSTNKEQQMALECMKAENKALQSELCVLRPMLGVAKTNVELELESYLELERGETRKIITALKKAEDLLATERLQFKQEIKTLQDVKHQTWTNKEQQMALEHMKAENQALQSELCVLRPMLCVEKTNVELELESYLELERGETRKIITALKKAQDLLATERLQFKQEITDLQDLKHQTSLNKDKQLTLEHMKAEHEALQSELCAIRPMLVVSNTNLELERAETRKITTALKKAEDLLATERLRFQQEIKTLQDVKHQTLTNKEQQMALEHMKAENQALQSELCVLRPMLGVEKTNVELESYLELERGETRKITTALKKAQDLLATERLQFKRKITDLKDLKNQTSLNKDKQLTLERMKAENEALKSKLHDVKSMLALSKTNLELEFESNLKLERAKTRKITTALKKAEDLLATERLRFQQEIKTLQDVKNQTSTNKEQQMTLERIKAENKALQSELCVLRPMLGVEKTNVELESYLELERGETRKITTALKKAEDLLATERLQFKQEITDLQDLKHQTSLNKDKQLTLEHMKAENEALQSELCVLRPMLVVSNTNLELESHLQLERTETGKITTALKKAQDLLATERLQFKRKIADLQDLKNQTSLNKDKQLTLERIKAENEALKSELHAVKLMLDLSKTNLELEFESNLEFERAETRKITAALKKAEDLLQTEHLRFQREITDLQEETEKSKTTCLAQLEAQTSKLMGALNEAQQELKIRTLQWQEENIFLTAKLEVSHVIHLAQLEMHASEKKTFVSLLQEKAEAQLEGDHLLEQLMEEVGKTKTSYETQLEEQQQANKKLVDNLNEAVQKMERNCIHLEEDRLTVLRDKERLKYNQQMEKEEWQKTESYLKSQIECQTLQKKEKKKWFKWQGNRPTLPQDSTNLSHNLQKKEQKWKSCKSTLLQDSLRLERNLQEREQVWQEERSTLLQTTDWLKNHQQAKEQEWQKAESSLKSQLTDLQSLNSKKKKETWFKGFF